MDVNEELPEDLREQLNEQWQEMLARSFHPRQWFEEDLVGPVADGNKPRSGRPKPQIDDRERRKMLLEMAEQIANGLRTTIRPEEYGFFSHTMEKFLENW